VIDDSLSLLKIGERRRPEDSLGQIKLGEKRRLLKQTQEPFLNQKKKLEEKTKIKFMKLENKRKTKVEIVQVLKDVDIFQGLEEEKIISHRADDDVETDDDTLQCAINSTIEDIEEV